MPRPSEPEPASAPLRIGWFTAACVLVSNIIGGGIFTTTGFLARDIGDPRIILALWLLGALVGLAGAMVYAELGAMLPRVGGDYLYLREAYGPLIAFLSGWTSLTIGFGASIAASSASFAAYVLRVISDGDEHGAAATLLALGLIWSLTAVHAAGIVVGGALQRLLTSAKVVAIGCLVLGGFAFGQGRWTNLSIHSVEVHADPGSLAVAFIFVMYCYLGWNVVGYIAGEIIEPAKTLPRVMVAGTAFVAVIYLCLNGLYFYALSIPQLAEPPILPVAEKAAAALWGPSTARWLAIMLALSIAGGVSAMMWAGPRVYWAMARDGVVTPWLAAHHAPNGAPVRSILLQSAWASTLVITGTFEQLVIYSGVVLALFMVFILGAFIRLRRRTPKSPQRYSAPLYPWLPFGLMLGALGVLGNSLLSRPVEFLLGMATVLAGLPLYWWWNRIGTTVK